MQQYRHEWKHEINYADLVCIRSRLREVMEVDSHAVKGKYTIRSLYFDNLEDKALREKLYGLNYREKFRLRYYNSDTSLVRLEKKRKISGLEVKEIAVVTEEEVCRLLDGDIEWMISTKPQYYRPLATELYVKMKDQGLRPKTIVEYTREPYIYRPGNVRVTFDYDIRTGPSPLDFLDPDSPTICPNCPDKILLEVKWDDFLPDIVRNCVQTPGRRVEAFSKYAQCRVFG